MSKNGNYYYLVEGETEEKLIKELKSKNLIPGKIKRINLIEKTLSQNFLRANIQPDTVVILVFDVDVKKISTLEENINILKEFKVKRIICIPQIENFEQELIFATNIKKISELTNSTSDSNFKTDFLKISNLSSKLDEKKFSIIKFWSRNPSGIFSKIVNESHFIKL